MIIAIAPNVEKIVWKNAFSPCLLSFNTPNILTRWNGYYDKNGFKVSFSLQDGTQIFEKIKEGQFSIRDIHLLHDGQIKIDDPEKINRPVRLKSDCKRNIPACSAL